MTIRLSHHKDTGLPVPNATLPYWRTEPHWLDEHRSTEGLPATCDILIIGTGMTGVSTAYHLLNEDWPRNPSVVLVEARQVCSGATGRNGGHIKIMPPTCASQIQKYGETTATAVVSFVHDTIHAIKQVIEKEKLDCEHELRRSFDVFLDSNEAEDTKRDFETLVGKGFSGFKDVDLVNSRYVGNITSIKGVKTGLGSPALSLWPYKFVIQLLERVLRRGANLQTNTLVTSVRECADGSSLVETSRGKIKALRVVFASNAYTGALAPQFEGVIVPYKGQCAHLAVDKDRSTPRLANTYNIHHRPDRVEYLNPRPDGSIVVGGGQHLYSAKRELWYNTTDDSTLIEAGAPFFEGYMQRTFRGWEDSGAYTERVWTGIMGKTTDGLPHVGTVPGTQNQFVCAGFNGGGMPLIFLSSLGIARMIYDGRAFDKTGIPKIFETTADRLSQVDDHSALM